MIRLYGLLGKQLFLSYKRREQFVLYMHWKPYIYLAVIITLFSVGVCIYCITISFIHLTKGLLPSLLSCILNQFKIKICNFSIGISQYMILVTVLEANGKYSTKSDSKLLPLKNKTLVHFSK